MDFDCLLMAFDEEGWLSVTTSNSPASDRDQSCPRCYAAIYARRQMTEHQVFGKFKRDETPGSPRSPPRHPCLFLQTWMTSSLARFRLSSYGPKHRFSTIHVSPRVLSNSGLLQMSGRTSYEVFVTISMNKTQQVEQPGYPSALKPGSHPYQRLPISQDSELPDQV